MIKRVVDVLSEGTGIRFIVVGLFTAALYFIIFYVLYSVFEMMPYIATTFAYTISFGVAYFSHNIWTYKSTASVGQSLPRYFLLQASCLVLTAGGTQLLYELFQLNSFVISVLATLFAGMISFVVSSLWVFSNVDERAE